MTKRTRTFYSYNFLIPGAILYVVLFILPTLVSFYYSLTDWNLMRANFVGLKNFETIITDPDISIAFKNTAIFTVLTVVIKITLGLLLALLVNSGLRTQNFLRSAFFFPVILSSVAVGLMFSSLFYPTHGLVNGILTTVGLGAFTQDWLGDPRLVMYSVSFIDIWKGAGYDMVILLAGLQSVPKDYYEAVSIDGGNKWQILRGITLPMIRPAINSCIILNLIGAIRTFDIIWVTTKGGPGFSSQVLGTIIYRQYSDGYYGIATALGVLLFMVISLIVFPTYLALSKKEVEM